MASISELRDFLIVNYFDLYPNSSPVDEFFRLFASPYVPLISVVLYLLASDYVFVFLRTVFDIQPKGKALQLVTMTHSLILALYSIWTFVNGMQIIAPLVIERGFYGALCDPSLDVWTARDFGFWVTHFYISKYYEFVDTWIIILKGRQPMILQTFHHAGIVLISWSFVVTKNTGGGAILLCFNSFIHSIMYTYYTFAAMGYTSSLKKYITQAQLAQFIVGGALTIPLHFIDNCVNPAQSAALISIKAYLVILVYLFAMFYASAYNKKK